MQTTPCGKSWKLPSEGAEQLVFRVNAVREARKRFFTKNVQLDQVAACGMTLGELQRCCKMDFVKPGTFLGSLDHNEWECWPSVTTEQWFVLLFQRPKQP